MIFRNLLQRKGRTLLAVMGIAIGMAAIIGLRALTDGLEAGYGSVVSGSEADYVLRDAKSMDMLLSSIDESIAGEIEAMPGVKAVSPMVQGLLQTDSSLYFFIFGYPQGSFSLEHFKLIEGDDLFSREADALHGKPILLGSAAAESYGSEIGSSLRIGATIYRVVGIYETGEAFEDGGAVMRMSDAQALLGKTNKVSVIYIQVEDPKQGERVKERLERDYPDLTVSTAENLENKSVITDFINVMVSVVGGMAIIIGGIAMTNSQLMSVYERTREIGVLRAVGWSRMRVIRMILGESVLVGILGGAAGTGLAWVMLVLNRDSLSAFGATTNISPNLLGFALGMVALLGTLGGLYPAIRASRLEPVEALRYEGGSSGDAVHLPPFGGLAFKNLFQRKSRTLMTLVVIAVTIAALLTTGTMLGSVDHIFGTFFQGGEVAVRENDVANMILSSVDERDVDRVAALSEVRIASSILISAMTLPDIGIFIVQGYDPHQEAILELNVVEGERITGNRQIMVGRQFSVMQNLGVGDTLSLGGVRYRITGIFEHSLALFEMGGVISLRDAQNISGHPGKATFFSLSLYEPEQAQTVVNIINQKFPGLHASLSTDFATDSPNYQSAAILRNGTSLLAVLVGGVAMMNTMLMSTLERTREIGVLRALGWRRRDVVALILKEALILGIWGGCMGIVMSLVMVTVIQNVLIHDPDTKLVWSLWNLVRALGVAISLALAGGIYPAIRATGMQPVEALKYE